MRTSGSTRFGEGPPKITSPSVGKARDALRRPRGLENCSIRRTDFALTCAPKSLASRALGPHPFPSRTRSLSQAAPMVLRSRDRGRVGRCRHLVKPSSPIRTDPGGGGFCVSLSFPTVPHATTAGQRAASPLTRRRSRPRPTAPVPCRRLSYGDSRAPIGARTGRDTALLQPQQQLLVQGVQVGFVDGVRTVPKAHHVERGRCEKFK